MNVSRIRVGQGGLLLLACVLMGYIVAPILIAQQQRSKQETATASNENKGKDELPEGVELETANFGAGCFWCVEAVFQELEGVYSVESGFMGGHVDNPTYEQVCEGKTGHAEIGQIKFDPAVISFKELLEVFWKVHDPTTLNRQGNDHGTQYRSAIFYVTDDQKQLAETYRQRLDESQAFPAPIVTEIVKASRFYPAGNYHEDYFRRNPGARYCTGIIRPKVDKFRKAFGDKLKKPVEK